MITISFNSVIEDDYRVTITDVLGEGFFNDILPSYIGDYNKKVDLSKYAKAIYFLKIKTSSGTVIKKITLQWFNLRKLSLILDHL